MRENNWEKKELHDTEERKKDFTLLVSDQFLLKNLTY